MNLHNKFKWTAHTSAEIQLFLHLGLELAIFVHTIQCRAMFSYTTPPHIVHKTIVPHVVSKYGMFADERLQSDRIQEVSERK